MLSETKCIPMQCVNQVMDCLGDVVYCIKDDRGTYQSVNQSFVARVGQQKKADVLGKKAVDIFPSHLARVYEEQDQKVIQSSRPLLDQLELIPRADGGAGWYLSSKFPLTGEDTDVVGILGVSQDLGTPNERDTTLSDLRTAVRYVQEHLDTPLRTEELADHVGLSTAQLDRRMRKVFRLSTKRYVMKCRLDRTTQLLAETDLPLADIALACGFSDQSAMTRQFCVVANETPSRFRKSRRKAE